jgi:hypothetical protein
MLGGRPTHRGKRELAMKRIAALVAAAAVISTLAAITRAIAQQLPPPPVCATWEKRQLAQICISDCFKKFPKTTPVDRKNRMVCQDACIAACRII